MPRHLKECLDESLLEFLNNPNIPHEGDSKHGLMLVEDGDFTGLSPTSRLKGLHFKCDPSEVLKIREIFSD